MILETEKRISGTIELLPLNEVARFIGLAISLQSIQTFVSKLCSLNGGRKYFDNYCQNRTGKYHLTLVSSVEFPFINNSEILKLIGQEVEVKLIGLGSATENTECCFFVVCESFDLSSLRANLALPIKDFHITIGFGNRDLHEISKGKDSLIKN